MKLSELSPFPVFINWEGTFVELKPFSLRAITWAERFFFREGIDGLKRMESILENGEGQDIFFNSLIDIVYYLGMEGFEDVGVSSPCLLKKKITESEEKDLLLSNFNKALSDVLFMSFPKNEKRPEFKGGKSFDELNKNKNGESQDSEEWEQTYVEFYRAGGMKLEEFMSLTMRQVGLLMKEIQHKKHEELNILSDLIHKKISFKRPQRKFENTGFTQEDVKTFERIHQQLIEQSRVN